VSGGHRVPLGGEGERIHFLSARSALKQAVRLSVYDKEFEPVITFAFDTGRLITNWLDSLVAGTYWGQVAVNHLRERVKMTHVVLSIPAIVIAAIVLGIPLNWLLGGTRTVFNALP
jgi:hypothetical protein